MADWRASLLGKGLKLNAGKSKVMIVNPGKLPVVSVGKEYRQTMFSAQYVKMDSHTVQWYAW